MKQFSLLLFLLLPYSFYGQTSYKQNLIDVAVINFSGKPEILDTLGKKLYNLSAENLQQSVVLSNYAPNDKFELGEGELSRFYDGFISGTLKSTGGKLLYRKDVIIDGMKAVEFEFTISPGKAQTDHGFQRIIYTDKGIFILSYLLMAGERASREKEREIFFNSFQFTIEKQSILQFTTAKANKTYDNAFLAGQIAGYVLIAGLFVLIIVLLTRKKIIHGNPANGKRCRNH